ncbi:MAG: SMP-30/gluconolactonase/LRE family protein [Opitutales bacterium]
MNKKNLLLILASISICTPALALNFDKEAEQIATGFKFVEGPLYLKSENALIFSDIPASKIYKVDQANNKEVYIDNSQNSNGIAIDKDGKLYACHKRSLSHIDKDKKINTIATEFDGKKLNAPNDLTIKSNGDIYFTDPNYGLKGDAQELKFQGIFRISKDSGELTLLNKDLVKPNGITFSPDEKILYVADHGADKIYSFKLKEDGTLESPVLFKANVKKPDGMKVDQKGNLFCATRTGVVVFDASGKELGNIKVSAFPSNCAFSSDYKTLYITAQKSIYKFNIEE